MDISAGSYLSTATSYSCVRMEMLSPRGSA